MPVRHRWICSASPAMTSSSRCRMSSPSASSTGWRPVGRSSSPDVAPQPAGERSLVRDGLTVDGRDAAAPDRVLICRDLHKRFGALEAVRGVTLHIAEGETYGLLGPNGA